MLLAGHLTPAGRPAHTAHEATHVFFVGYKGGQNITGWPYTHVEITRCCTAAQAAVQASYCNAVHNACNTVSSVALKARMLHLPGVNGASSAALLQAGIHPALDVHSEQLTGRKDDLGMCRSDTSCAAASWASDSCCEPCKVRCKCVTAAAAAVTVDSAVTYHFKRVW
jgi:hypothetical protein